MTVDFASSTSESPSESHRAEAPESVSVAVLTLSDTRDRDMDRSGSLIQDFLAWRGHTVVAYEILPDDAATMRDLLLQWISDPSIDAIITNGGTGISSRDSTHDVVSGLLEKRLDGFGELFRTLSWEEIGAAAMLSRAIAGTAGQTAIFALPGSSNAVQLAMEKLIGPELAHVVHELRKHHQPETSE